MEHGVLVLCRQGRDVSRNIVMEEKVLCKQVVVDMVDYETHV